jgi:regulator of protease activity HflC (stomatin/prohibitin superfamily)
MNEKEEKKKVFSLFIVGFLSVGEKERVVIERFGRYARTLKPGLRMIWFPGIVERIKEAVFIEQEEIPLFLEPIRIDFRDGSAAPKNTKAFIEIKSPDNDYLTEQNGVETKKAGVYRAVYHIKDRKGAIRDRLENAVRSYLNSLTIEEGLEAARGGFNIYNRIETSQPEDAKEIKAAFDDWGILLHTITIGDFDLEPDLVKTRGELHKRVKEREAAAEVAQQRAKETVGTLVNMLSENTGIPREKLQESLKTNPKDFISRYDNLLKQNLDLVHRRMAIDGKSFIDIRVPQGTTLEGLVAEGLVALAKRIPVGGNEKTGREEEQPKRRKMKTVTGIAGITAEVPEREEEEEET